MTTSLLVHGMAFAGWWRMTAFAIGAMTASLLVARMAFAGWCDDGFAVGARMRSLAGAMTLRWLGAKDAFAGWCGAHVPLGWSGTVSVQVLQ
jgi:hypothetical protein